MWSSCTICSFKPGFLKEQFCSFVLWFKILFSVLFRSFFIFDSMIHCNSWVQLIVDESTSEQYVYRRIYQEHNMSELLLPITILVKYLYVVQLKLFSRLAVSSISGVCVEHWLILISFISSNISSINRRSYCIMVIFCMII